MKNAFLSSRKQNNEHTFVINSRVSYLLNLYKYLKYFAGPVPSPGAHKEKSVARKMLINRYFVNYCNSCIFEVFVLPKT